MLPKSLSQALSVMMIIKASNYQGSGLATRDPLQTRAKEWSPSYLRWGCQRLFRTLFDNVDIAKCAFYYPWT